MRSLSFLRLRLRVSFDMLVTLGVIAAATALVIGFQVLRRVAAPGGDGA